MKASHERRCGFGRLPGFWRVAWFAGALAWAAAGGAAPTDPAAAASAAAAAPSSAVRADGDKPTAPAATLRLLNREVITLRAELAGASPEVRVERALERLRGLPDSAIDTPLKVIPFTLGEARGVQFLLGDQLLFSVLRGDVDAESGQSFDELVRQTRVRAEEVRQAWHQSQDRALLLRGLLGVVAAAGVLALMIWLVYRGGRRLVDWLEAVRDRLAANNTHVDWREFLARLAARTVQLVQWFVLLLMGYVWLRFVLGSFVVSAPIADQLGGWLWRKLAWVGQGLLEGLPGLASIVIVLTVTRAIVDVLGYFFDAIQKGRLKVPMMHPETIAATRRIVTLIAWGLGVAVAYPFLPGASSEAFKGLSVLFGLMLTLGSTGIATQAMSGLVVVYARALRRGDFVQVNGVEGVVTEVASLATKIVNIRNEEITIPNSVLISNPIHNFSKLSGQQGTLVSTRVTIGYDAPWRQVQALLVGAAVRTPGVRADPAPFVYQRALSDFYVEYELFASIDRPLERVPILSALHGHIQDLFNEHGVQIMSPHFLSQPESPVVVPRSFWHAPPAAPDSSANGPGR